MKNHPFPTQTLPFVTGPTETVIIGGPTNFGRINEALPEDFQQVAVIGWGSQGPSHAQNLRKTFTDIRSDVRVVVGLRKDSKSIPSAEAAGFTHENGTLGEMYQVISESDLVIIHISDGAQVDNYKKIFAAMRPGATIGFSHAFIEGHLTHEDVKFPDNINVVMVAPKGMGPSLLDLYGKGSGINSSVAIHQDVNGDAWPIAAAWSVGIGSPVTFGTTMPKEWKSDIFGERAILLGGIWGAIEALYNRLIRRGCGPNKAFQNSAQAITGFISPEISKLGLKGFYETHIYKTQWEDAFSRGYAYARHPFEDVMDDVYETVSSGVEIAEVIEATRNLEKTPMTSIEDSPMWQVGKRVRLANRRVSMNENVAFAAGVFIAGVMAQLELLLEKGHCVSELVNESLFELTDSLIPFMHAKGLAHMIDNCSTTAKLGARKWGPKFQEVLEDAFRIGDPGSTPSTKWLEHKLHEDIMMCNDLKPENAIADPD